MLLYSNTCFLRSTAPFIPPSATTLPIPIYLTSSTDFESNEEKDEEKVVKATREPLGMSGNNHGSLKCLTAAMNSGAPVKMGGGIGLWSSIIGKGGDGRGRDRSETDH